MAEVYSCTSSPAWVWRVPLVIVPRRLTVSPARATCGFIPLMWTESPAAAARPAVCAAGLACAARAGAAARATAANADAMDRVRRLRVADSQPCTPGMLVSAK